MRMCYTHRRLLSQLALNLAQEDKPKQAAQVLALADQELPAVNVPHDFQSGSLDIARTYASLGNKAKAMEIIGQLWNKSMQYMAYYNSLSPAKFSGSQQDCMLHLYVMENLTQLASQVDEKKSDELMQQLDSVIETYQNRGGSLGY